MIPSSVSDYRLLAKKRLPHFLCQYIDGGAFSETTLTRNHSDLQQLALRQRVLRDVSHISTSTLLGQPLSWRSYWTRGCARGWMSCAL